MFDPRLGMKIYDNVWYVEHLLEPEQAADILSSMGVSFVLSQSKLIPMQDTAIASEITAEHRTRFEKMDDRAFRDALKDRDIGYFCSLNFGFDPKFIAAHPELLPTDQFGRKEEKVDWYIGLPPDRMENLEHKSRLLEAAVTALEPEGIHLGFIRWPGFWEIWLPDVRRSQMPDYCYGQQTLARFCQDGNIDLPITDAVASAELVATRHREAWRDWKCRQTVKTVGSIKSRLGALKPGIKVVINTLPFFIDDFGNAVEEIFGQSPSQLSQVADVFEVMAYHQILRRDPGWTGRIGTDVKRRSGRTTVCTIQGSALYLHGMHADHGRKKTVDADEFIHCIDSVEDSEADGLCVFTFTDFLNMRHTSEGRRRIERLKSFRR
ncbi:MAG TPA: hypothetical protein VIB38_09705 [Aestuariivirgaceae bacterium]|jgi:hypothetical protein